MDNYNFKSINGNDFNFNIQDRDSVRVLNAGYIITPEGCFIPISDKESHADVFSRFLSKYLDQNIRLESINAAVKLTNLGFIVYFGIKPTDMKSVINNNFSRTGFGIMMLPSDISDIPKSQKDAVIDLINSNKSLFGDRKILDIEYYSFIDQSGKSVQHSEEKIIDLMIKKDERK